MWASTAAALTTVAFSLAPALPNAAAATASASKTKHQAKHVKHVKCKKGFVERHGRCVSSVTPVY
jgi:hypothetical protein